MRRARPRSVLASALPALLVAAPGGARPPPAVRDASPPALAPIGAPARPAAARGPAWAGTGASLVREGAVLRDRRGRLVRAEGQWVYVFDADAEGIAEPPMAVLPCRRLREMTQMLEVRAKTLTFQVTGQVFVFEGANYLLPSFVSVAAAESAPSADAPAAAASAGERDPSSSDLLREMADGAARPAPSAAARGGASDAADRDTTLLREGLTIVSRRGRVTYDGASLVFSADGDAASEGRRPDPPLALLPCLNLEAIARVVERRGDRAVFIMSGRVFVHEGRNYLLPTFFVVEKDREGNLTAAQ